MGRVVWLCKCACCDEICSSYQRIAIGARLHGVKAFQRDVF